LTATLRPDPAEVLQGTVLAVVAADEATCEKRAAPLRAAGAVVRAAIVHVDALAMLSAAGFDAAVLDVGQTPEVFMALARSVRDDARTRSLPLLVLAAGDVAARRVASLGPVHVAAADEGREIADRVAEIVGQRQAETRAVEYARALEERLRVAIERLAAMRTDAETVTHDARVLCGIVVGYAANLRDDIAGPLDPMHREHVAQILEAAKDTTALVDRFAAAVRLQTDLPAETHSLPPPARRANRRTLVDLADVASTTAHLFKTMAEEKSVRVEVEARAPVPIWCDALQVKQVVTNLLVNAIKFSPAGGRVLVSARSVAPSGAMAISGPGARQHAELVVSDTGPGIPPGDRHRVFERGVRLERDQRVAGSGIGLAVVREIVLAHRGTVQAEEAQNGGASLVVRLPLDMRTRRDSSIVLIDDPGAAQRIVGELRSKHDGSVRPLPGDPDGLASALEACRAVVVVPRGPRFTLDDLLDGARAPTPTPAPVHGGKR
jgi:signal transduction histidine kinase